jgi:hypothetical protein
MKPTVSGISQLDEPPRPHSTQEEALDASESMVTEGSQGRLLCTR